MDAAYWCALAADYLTAYGEAFPAAPVVSHRNALILAMSVAEHETNNGRAWSGSNNFGAVQLRSLTQAELTSFKIGTLKIGDFTPSRDGVLHVDTHPTPQGPEPYAVWFAAFPTRVAGVAHFLRTLWHDSAGAPDMVDASCADVARAMYLGAYFEGAHHGARPVGHRTDPLNVAELANIGDYAMATQRCRGDIEPMLEGWAYGLDECVDDAEPHVTPRRIPLPFDPNSQPPPVA